MNEQGEQLGFTDYVGLVWQRRKAALLAAGVFACVTFVAFNFVPRQYTARATFERRGDIIAARTEKSMPESFATLKPMLTFDLTGGPAVRKALTDIGYLDDLPRDAAGELTHDAQAKLDRQVGEIQSGLRAIWRVRSQDIDRVEVTLTSKDPVLTYALPNQLAKNYMANTRRILLDQLAGTQAFLTERMTVARAKATKVREQRYNFLKGHPDMLPENPHHLEQRLTELDTELQDLREQQASLRTRLVKLTDPAAKPAESGPINHRHVEAVGELRNLKGQLVQLRNINRMTDTHPRVIKLAILIEQAEAKLKAIPARLPAAARPSSEIEPIQTTLVRLASKISRREELRNRYRVAQANFLPVSREYERLTTLIEQSEDDVAMWKGNCQNVQMALEAEQNDSRTHLKLVKAAAPVYRPSWPALWHVFGLAIGGGLAFGIMLAIGLARLSRRFSSAEETQEMLGLPLLGVIGPIYSPAARRMRAIRRYILAPAMACILLTATAIAAAGVVMATNYPGRYAQVMEHVTPTTRAMWHGVQSLLGSI